MAKPMILLVSDQPKEIHEIESVIGDDYQLIPITNGSDAISFFEMVSSKVRIVLLSLDLHEVPSLELLKSMRSMSLGPEIIVYSSTEQLQTAVAALKAGAFDYLLTPIDPDRWMLCIEKALVAVESVEKLAELNSHEFIDRVDFEKRYALALELIAKRRMAGEVVSDEELFMLFPVTSEEQSEYSFESIKHMLEDDTGGGPIIRKTPKLLVVEDDPQFSEDLRAMLSDHYDLIMVMNGADALLALEQNRDVELVLLDIYLPDTTGVKLLPKIKALNENLEVVISTAYQEFPVAIETLQNGACDYLNKPYLKNDLLTTLSRALQRRYLRVVIPELRRRFLEEELSEEHKLDLLKTLCDRRSEENAPVMMRDVYMFFPELRRAHIPEEFTLPTQVYQESLADFIKKIRVSVST